MCFFVRVLNVELDWQVPLELTRIPRNSKYLYLADFHMLLDDYHRDQNKRKN